MHMSYLVDGYHYETVASAPPSVRVQFIRRTYLHLAGAILAFVGIEAALFSSGMSRDILLSVFASKISWVVLMLAFVGVGYAAQAMARARNAVGLQYAGLSLYVLLEVIIFLPILTVADFRFPNENLPLKAGIVTLVAFAGLTLAVFVSGKDFSFLGPIIWVVGLLAFGMVIAAACGVLTLGLGFSVAMVALASAYIVYDTSNVMHHYATDQHVAAALELFASVALMFYYVLRIFMSARDD
jgi:FtsH-binding integral membrane protein